MLFIISYFQELISKLHYHVDNAKDQYKPISSPQFLILGLHIFSWQYYFLSMPINSHPLILRAWLGCYTHFLRSVEDPYVTKLLILCPQKIYTGR